MNPKLNNHTSIRRAVAEDAKAFLELFEDVVCSTNFLGFEPGERAITLEAQKGIFERQNISQDMHLLAIANGSAVGFASVLRQFRRKTRHIGTLVIGVHPKYQGAGLGALLCEAAVIHAREEGLSRLELTVVTVNTPAVRLYLAQGYVTEGVRHGSMICGGQLLDEYYMGQAL